MRTFVLAAAALMVTGAIGEAAAQGFARGPYTWDGNAICRDGTGNAVPDSLCPLGQKPKKPACHDPSSGKAEPCETSGAVPDSPPTGRKG